MVSGSAFSSRVFDKANHDKPADYVVWIHKSAIGSVGPLNENNLLFFR